ncbi:MAG TPA: EF-hand domain-containing protein, partial [Candidatus Poseidoniales archaeon]
PEPEISLASAFDAPLSQQEVREAFDEMDTNKDGVISEDEFRSSPMVAKLPEPMQKEMFERIDTNKDEVLQYEEFSVAAEDKPSAQFLAPKRAPVVQPVRSPIQQPQSPPAATPPAPAQMPRPVPQPVQTSKPANSGRHRSGVPGVHHVLQTGIYCGSCNIAVEHHWRHCPICGSQL